MRKFIFALAAFSLAMPAIAATDSSTPQPEKPKKEKKICKRVQGSDSRIAVSECKTAAEWERNPTVAGTRSTITGRPSDDSGQN